MLYHLKKDGTIRLSNRFCQTNQEKKGFAKWHSRRLPDLKNEHAEIDAWIAEEFPWHMQ